MYIYIYICVYVCVCMCVCVCVCVCVGVCVFRHVCGVFFLGGGGTPLRHGHKESYKDLNLKNSTSEWDSNPRPHEY